MGRGVVRGVIPLGQRPFLDLQAQPVPADEFVMGMARLEVLTHHMHVLEGALEEMPFVDCGRTGSVVNDIDDLDREPNRVRGSET